MSGSPSAGVTRSPGAGGRGARGDVSRARRLWRWSQYLVGLALAALALWALASRRGELSGATTYLDHMNWGWLAVAAAAELGSLAAFALIQRRLLAAAGVEAGMAFMVRVTLAETAIANSMPAGPLVSSVFAYRQYRRRGADEGVAVWSLAAVFVAASVTLALVASVGVAVAGAEGSGLDLVGVTIVVLVVTLAVGAVFVQRRALASVVTATLRGSRRLLHWPAGDLAAHVDRVVGQLTTVVLTPRAVVDVAAWGIANWVLDCGCLGLCFLAVGVGIPWKGLLLAYGAGQLAANLPVTPGGLGVVEGSLTIALVAFGGAETSTAAAVLLYRIVTFWAELPLGWVTWAAMTWRTRLDEAPATEAVRGDIAEVVA